MEGIHFIRGMNKKKKNTTCLLEGVSPQHCIIESFQCEFFKAAFVR